MGRFLRIAWRNVWRNGRRTVIAIAAMSLALTLIVAFDGMMGGMTGVMYENTVRHSGGHVLVHALGYREKANQLPLYPIPGVHADAAVEFAMTRQGVTAAAKRIQTAGLLSSREGSFPTVFIGIEPEREEGAALLSEQIVAGRYLTTDDEDVILIGRGMADALDVGVGDRITLSGRATHEQMRQVEEDGQPIIVEHSGSPRVVVLSVAAYERLLAAREAQEDWRELVDRAREQIRVDLGGRELTPPETVLREMREARDEQLVDMR